MKSSIVEVKRVSERIKIPDWLYQELQEEDFLQGKTPVLFVDMYEEEE